MESCTRRGLIGMLAAVFSAACAAGAASSRAEQSGIFALLGGTPAITSKLWVSQPTGLGGTLNVRQFTANGKPILNYDVDMEHVMHMIIVRDDFATFDHVHPDFNTTTGTFSQNFKWAPNQRYYVYADSTPHGLAQQVFRFTLGSAGPVSNTGTRFTPSDRTESAGPYAVTLSQTTLTGGQPKALNVTVLKNGEPAKDLTPYLGAAAHVVFINTSTLAYVHIHPTLRAKSGENAGMDSAMHMPMPSEGKAGPFMQMGLPALPAGTYKVWLQFRGNGKLYTVPFTLLAR